MLSSRTLLVLCLGGPVTHAAAAAAKLLQSCPTLCDPIDGSPPGSPVPGVPQARTLEWVAISFSNAWKWKVKVKSLSRAWLLVTPWIAAYQAPPSMGFSKQQYWSGVPLPSPQETQETWIWSLGPEDPLKEMAIHSSILAWRTQWQGRLAGYSPRGWKESDTTEHAHTIYMLL